jgi:hypothetical protein
MTTALASNANASTLNGVRSLAVIDIENLLGDDPRVATSAGIRATIAACIERADLRDDDLIVIACNPALALLVHDAAPHGLLRCQRGENGADLALLDELDDVAWIAGRFDRVVIGSGDGIFADAIQRLNHAGVETTVVANHRQTACAVRVNASTFRPLGSPAQFALAA